MRRFISSLFVFGVLAVLQTGIAPAAESDPQILFYLDNNRLITLDFQITWDGKSFSEQWESQLDQQFKKIDKNQDGTISGEERDGLPNPRVLRLFNRAMNQAVTPATLDREAFGRHIAKLGFQPFQVSIQGNASNQLRYSAFGMQTNPNQAAETLFARLDRDADNRLSREEMQEALETLSKQDLDQDETISTSELVPVNFGQYFVSPSSPSNNQSSAFLSLGSGTNSRQVTAQLTQKYDKNPKDNALSQDELGVSETLFAKHDIDGNGKWDFEEIQQYLRSPTADVVVHVRLGTPSKLRQPHIEFQHGKELSSEFKNSIGSLNLGSVQMEVSLQSFRNRKVEDQLKMAFRGLDNDNNGYIDKMEAQNIPNLNNMFQEIDRDKDEKIFVEELLDAVLPVAELLARQIQLSVTDRGRDLFRILDSDGDSRLAKREFWAMPDRASLWDKDGDGHVTLSDVPQQYRLVATQGDLNFLNNLRGVVVATPYGMPVQNGRSRTGGPVWFQKMDRNADGDVSPREFLGTAEDFQKLDSDKDGLISPEEAASAK